MADNLYLFANNNEGVAENLGSYRLYDMKIEGEPEGVSSGVNYVDYLIGDGASWIDTGLYTKSNTKVEIRLSNISFIIGKHFFGSDKFVLGFQSAKGNWVFSKHGASGILNGMDSYSNNDEIISIIMDMNDNQYVVDINNNKMEDNEYKYISNLDSSKTLKIFTSHYAGYGLVFDDNIQNRISIFNLYSFKVYEGDNLVQDLKPCLDTQGVPCMYDEVSKQYFYNQGTGTFGYEKTLRDYQPVLDSNNIPCLLDKKNMKYYYNKGTGVFDTKEKVKYRKLKYIQGDGDNYLDLGNWTIDENTKIELKSDLDDNSSLFYIGLSNSYGFNSALGIMRLVINKNDSVTFPYTSSVTLTITNENFICNQKSNDIDFPSDFNVNGKLYLFKTATHNLSLKKSCNIHYFKMYESDELVLDLIPVLDSNDIPCVYDLVSEQFFYNQGEGTFGYETEEAEAPEVNYVEYIRGTGDTTCSFDTGIPFDNTWSKIELKVNFETTGYTYGELIKDASSLSFANFALSDNWDYLGFTYCQNGVRHTDKVNKKYEKKADTILTYTSNCWKMNDETALTIEGEIDNGKANLNILTYDCEKIKLYYYKVWDKDSNLIQDLRPCLDENGIPCLYDNISKKFIYSKNNNLPHGERVGYTEIEYIESTGTQYIDTEVVPTTNTDIDMTCRACDYNESPTINNSYILNELAINSNTYQYNDTDTTVQPNLLNTEAATLTMGTSNLNKLDEEDIEVATNNGWSLV